MKNHSLTLKNIFTLVFALLPIFANYKFFQTENLNITIAHVLILILLPFEIYYLLIQKRKNLNIMFWVFVLYFIINTEFKFYYIIFILSIYFSIEAAVNKFIDWDNFRLLIVTVAKIAAVLVIMQTICYYLMGLHIPLNIPFIISEEGYIDLILTGKSTESNLYRPSAFFMEPSHMSTYCIIALLYLMYFEDEKKSSFKNQIFISAGMILTTSGLGIFMVIAAWCWKYFVLNGLAYKKISIDKIIRSMTFLILFVILSFILYNIPFIQSAVLRVMGKSGSGYNAITGRTFSMSWLLTDLTRKQWILGQGYLTRNENLYMTGFTMYTYSLGILGNILFFLIFINKIWKKDLLSVTCTVLYLVLFFFTCNVLLASFIWFGVIALCNRKNMTKICFKL